VRLAQPKKKNPETPEEQSKRFREAVRQMIDDGALSPTDAEDGIEALLGQEREKLDRKKD
jgi:hypothetical protein